MTQFKWYRWLRSHIFTARSFVKDDPIYGTEYVLIQGDTEKVANLMMVTGYREEWPRKEFGGSKIDFG